VDRIAPQPELADGFGRIKPHLVTRELHALERDIRFSVRDADRPEVFDPRISLGYPMRNLQFRRPDSGDSRERIKEFLERQVPSSENVSASNATFLGGKHVTFCAIANVNQVHSGVDVPKHFPAQKIYDDLAGWSRFDVEVSDRRAWIHNHHRQPSTRPV